MAGSVEQIATISNIFDLFGIITLKFFAQNQSIKKRKKETGKLAALKWNSDGTSSPWWGILLDAICMLMHRGCKTWTKWLLLLRLSCKKKKKREEEGKKKSRNKTAAESRKKTEIKEEKPLDFLLRKG